jgi:hypothetical protein
MVDFVCLDWPHFCRGKGGERHRPSHEQSHDRCMMNVEEQHDGIIVCKENMILGSV